MATPIVYNWPASNTTYVAALQSSVAAGSMTLSTQGNVPLQFPGFVRVITLTSAGNNAAVQFTINGTVDGFPISETIAGPNANTVSTVAAFATVTSIVANAAFNNVSAGIGALGRTEWFLCDYHREVFNLAAQVIVTGVLTYSFICTLDDVTKVETPTVFTPIAAMTAATTSQLGNLTIPIRYCCVIVTASNPGSSLVATILQQGIN